MLLKDLPKYECLLKYSTKYRGADQLAVAGFLSVLRLAVDLMSANQRYFAEREMSQGRFTILCLLSRDIDAPFCPADLALRAGVTRATMTGLLQGLEEEGLIRRAPCDRDKRKFLLQLTERGKRCIDTILPDWFTRIGEFISSIPARDIALLQKYLFKLHSRLDVFLNEGVSPPRRSTARHGTAGFGNLEELSPFPSRRFRQSRSAR